MTSNISDILRCNKPSDISTMMNSVSSLDILSNESGGDGSSAIGFSRRLSVTNNSAIKANVAAATSLWRPWKRAKLEGDEDQGDENTDFPPSEMRIASQQEQQHRHHPEQFFQELLHNGFNSSEQSRDDNAESRESLARASSPSSLHNPQQQQDGATSGIRFREYQAEIWSEKFEELCFFRQEHGHCHVPHYFQENQGKCHTCCVKMRKLMFYLHTKLPLFHPLSLFFRVIYAQQVSHNGSNVNGINTNSEWKENEVHFLTNAFVS
jgi:hypothetical protein